MINKFRKNVSDLVLFIDLKCRNRCLKLHRYALHLHIQINAIIYRFKTHSWFLRFSYYFGQIFLYSAFRIANVFFRWIRPKIYWISNRIFSINVEANLIMLWYLDFCAIKSRICFLQIIKIVSISMQASSKFAIN